MKKILLLALLGCQSCGFFDDPNAGGKKEKNTKTLVFFDKTASVNTNDAFVNEKYKAVLQDLINENINHAGDKLEVYYIHENTAKSRCLVINAHTEAVNEQGLNATDIEAAVASYEVDISKERKKIMAAVTEKMMATNEETSNNETNITGAVPVISKALEDGEIVRVYFFSDMVESKIGGRDFHKASPKSNEEAKNWANADADAFKNYNLSGSEIRVILPFKPTSSTKENNPTVSEYWKVFFDKIGAGAVEEI